MYRQLAITSLLAACASNTSGNTSVAWSLAQQPVTRDRMWSGPIVTIVMENHSRSDIVGKDAPYINRSPSTTPSPPVSRHRTSTRASRTTSGWSPARTSASSTIAIRRRTTSIDLAHRRPARARRADLEGVPGEHGRAVRPELARPYAAKHNPFVYFDDINGGTARSSTRRALHRARRRLLAARRDIAAGTVPRVRLHHAEPR